MFNTRSMKVILAVVFVFAFSAIAFADQPAKKEEVKDLARVEVTGSRLVNSIDDVPAPAYVITSADISKSGARNLQEVLTRVPGVIGLSGSSSMMQDKSVIVRGVNTEVLLLVDGVPFMNTHNGSGMKHGSPFDLRGIDLSTVERIEVVKGSSSAIYGSNAAGGVINVITRKGAKKSSGSIKVEAGSNEYYKGTIRGTAVMSDDLAVTLGYTRTEENGDVKLRKLDDVKVKELGKKKGVGLYDYSTGYKANDYNLKIEKGNWNFVGEAGDYKSDWIGRQYGSKYHQEDDYKRFSLNYADGTNTGRFYYNGIKKDYSIVGTTTLNKYDDKSIGLTFNRKQELFGLATVWGVDFKQDKGKFSGGDSNLNYDLKRNGIAPYIETSVKLGEANLDLGLRYEHWDIDQGKDVNEIIPRLSLNWLSETGKLFYATAGRVFVMPSFYQTYLPMVDEDFGAYGKYTYLRNPGLKPEKGWTYDIGVKDTKAKHPWKLGIFYMNIDDKIEYNTDYAGINTINQYQNRDEYRAWGIEGEVKFNINEYWSYTQGFAWTDADVKKTSDSIWTRSESPRLDLSGFINYKNGPWTGELALHYYGDRVLTSKVYDEDNIFIANLSVGWKEKNHTLKLACLNIFDKEYVLDNSGYINAERRFVASWEYEF
ncbi:MAG: TonB-dependent receptor [Synergistaceae bacterium]